MSVIAREPIETMSLDHDLGHCEACTGCKGYKSSCGCVCHLTGYSVALYMASTGRWPATKPTCHSANPAGRANIEGTIERYYNTRIVHVPGEFRLTWREQALADKFKDRHRKKHGRDNTAIGGRFTYSFTHTSLGLITSIACACRKKKTLTDFSEW